MMLLSKRFGYSIPNWVLDVLMVIVFVLFGMFLAFFVTLLIGDFSVEQKLIGLFWVLFFGVIAVYLIYNENDSGGCFY